MNISDLKKMKNADLKNVIRKYKKSNCPPYSTLKKSDLVDLIVKLKIKPNSTKSVPVKKSPVRTIPVKKSPIKKSPAPKSPAPKSPVSQDNSGIVDKAQKEKLLKNIAKMILKTKKDIDDTPIVGGPRMNKSNKMIELEEKLENLLTIQKYLNTIYRDNITEKVDRKKIKMLLK